MDNNSAALSSCFIQTRLTFPTVRPVRKNFSLHSTPRTTSHSGRFPRFLLIFWPKMTVLPRFLAFLFVKSPNWTFSLRHSSLTSPPFPMKSMLIHKGAPNASSDSTLTQPGRGELDIVNYYPEKVPFQIELCHMARVKTSVRSGKRRLKTHHSLSASLRSVLNACACQIGRNQAVSGSVYRLLMQHLHFETTAFAQKSPLDSDPQSR